MSEEIARPPRRVYQKALARKRRRLRRRRQARIRRVRMWRAVRTFRFWLRTGMVVVILMALAFWARFALVYDIPSYARQGNLYGLSAYVAEKPWWFGPPLFDLGAYVQNPGSDSFISNPYAILLQNLGRYQQVVISPHFIWVQKL